MKAASIPFQVTNTPAIIGDGNVNICLNTLWTLIVLPCIADDERSITAAVAMLLVP